MRKVCPYNITVSNACWHTFMKNGWEVLIPIIFALTRLSWLLLDAFPEFDIQLDVETAVIPRSDYCPWILHFEQYRSVHLPFLPGRCRARGGRSLCWISYLFVPTNENF